MTLIYWFGFARAHENQGPLVRTDNIISLITPVMLICKIIEGVQGLLSPYLSYRLWSHVN